MPVCSHCGTISIRADRCDGCGRSLTGSDDDRGAGPPVAAGAAEGGACDCGHRLLAVVGVGVTRCHQCGGVSLAGYDYYEAGEFEAVVEQAESIGDICEETGWGMTRVMQLLGIYGIDVGEQRVEATSSIVEQGPEPESARPGLAGRSAGVAAGRAREVGVDAE